MSPEGFSSSPLLRSTEGGTPFLKVDLQVQSVWGLADVKANRTNAKGTKLTRKQAAERFVIPLKSLRIVKLYVDF